MSKIKQNKNQEERISVNSSPSTQERLKIIANLIVDRIIEDQLNGNLRFKTQGKKYE